MKLPIGQLNFLWYGVISDSVISFGDRYRWRILGALALYEMAAWLWRNRKTLLPMSYTSNGVWSECMKER